MIITSKKRNRGFIALISTIIISVILLLVVTNLSLTGFYKRSNILDSELKERSSALAEACADTAILKLANNSNYTGGETITVSGVETCAIDGTSASDPRVFTIHAIFHNSYTNLQISINVATATVARWEEI